jgi:tetratricopeptide (TPR) repeat protein
MDARSDFSSRRTLRSLLTRDPKRSAEEALLAGDRKRAMESFARSGDWQRAAQLAAELGEDEKLVRYALMDAFGQLPQGRIPDTLSAAELLASKGRSTQAVLLFERAGAFHRAGESALASQDPVLAARNFKRAGAWMQAVRCLAEAGKMREALQAVDDGLRSLERMPAGGGGGRQSEELQLVRADLLLRTGRSDSAANLVRSLPPSPRLAEMLERGGLWAEAVQCHLDLNQPAEAFRAASRAPEPDRLRAQILLRTGKPNEAGHLLAQLGRHREAAEAYEKAEEWGRSAYRWEAADEPRRAGEAYEKAGRWRDASRCFVAAGLPQRAEKVTTPSRSGPSKVLATWGGQTLLKARQSLAAGDKTRAASLLFQIRPDEPGFAESVFLLAPLLIEEGLVQEALDRLRLLSSGKNSEHESECEYWEGRGRAALGQKDAAVACFERVIARAPGHRDAREQLEVLKAPAAPPVPAVEMPEVGGRLAGRYELLAEIGRGGMGRVFKARDFELDEIVAVKTLLAPSEERLVQEEARLLREVQICRRITHPNVVRIYDIGRFPGGLFVTMEHLEGRGLDTVINEDLPLPFERIRSVLVEIAAGLHEAHSQGIIHRDLKPANIIVTASRAKILDFGIASMSGLGARLTQTGIVMGTPMYIAPDQILGGEPDSRSDLYSLGVIAYTLIAGREPYDAAEATLLLLKQLHAQPPPIQRFRPETPAPWAALLDRLLAKNPQHRCQSAQEVLEVLQGLPV